MQLEFLSCSGVRWGYNHSIKANPSEGVLLSTGIEGWVLHISLALSLGFKAAEVKRWDIPTELHANMHETDLALWSCFACHFSY